MSAVELALDFALIKKAVAKQFDLMQRHPLFRVKVESEEMWACYLKSFPPGSNPIFRERTEHDCTCCRHFIRDVGNAVAIIDGKTVTLWDAPTGDAGYDAVCRAMAVLIRSRPIEEPFLHYDRAAGVDKNYEGRGTADVKLWSHFHVSVASAYCTDRKQRPTALSDKRASHDVLARALAEISIGAIDEFIDLVAQGSLYRGEEFKGAVQKFRTIKQDYEALPVADRSNFVWVTSVTESPSISRIRNTVAGTLLVDLSEGKEMEAAVAAYESKVAPTNYKRPSALVTPKMVAQARESIAGLGLASALDRRYALLSDVSVNNVLFTDRSARKRMADVFDELSHEASSRSASKKLDAVEEVSIETFISDILPRIDSVEAYFENRHGGNCVSLVAPADPAAGLLFRWPNKFSWSYAGELADSIKERVKRAGGNISGDLCCRLAWYNFDDLDFHMHEPKGGHIYFANRQTRSPCGGMLDVDMNAGHGTTREPVENIFYQNREIMREGTYVLKVNQYSKREASNPGFDVEIDWLGDVHTFSSERSPKQGETMVVAEMHYSKANGIEFETPLNKKSASRMLWNLPTEHFHRVSVMMLSPNHWDGEAVGNKHYFFMLDGCANDGTARGFFNEFLMPALDKHRKVFEMVGSKLKLAPAAEQLSGLGFSSTQRNALTCRVKGSFTRTIKIVF